MPERVLLILSDSRAKRQNGECFKPGARSFSRCVTAQLEAEFLSKRRAVRKLLRGGPPRLYDRAQQGGYRDESECNQQLIDGPDFGGACGREEAYLPAWSRYRGRFFNKLRRAYPAFWEDLPSQPLEILFVSGLYGLLLWDEPVQEYDCHLTDHAEGDASNTVGRCWSNVLTGALCEFVNRQKGTAHGRFTRIYDFLSEESYQLAVDWERITDCDMLVFHRMFKNSAGPDILPNVGAILGKHLNRVISGAAQFSAGRWYAAPGANEEFGFETRLFENPDAARENPQLEARRSLLREYPSLRSLPSRILSLFQLAETSWLQVQSLKEFDFGAVILSYSRAVESFLRSLRPEFGRLTLGPIVKNLGQWPLWESPMKKLEQLVDLRNNAVHSDRRIEKKDVPRARKLSLQATAEVLPLSRR